MADEPKPEGLFGRLLNSQDPTRDIKLLAFGAAVAASIWWLTKEQSRGPITSVWVEAFKWFLISVCIGGGAWAAVEKWNGGGGGPNGSV